MLSFFIISQTITITITKYGISKSRVDPCGVCSLGVKASSVLCGKWEHGRCDGMKMVTPKP